ncbi:MAG: phospho-sugar mutase, partial [Lachnospiraceae bacterium]|nr:phospho-sugar mutase [Lachnospiraceae bacterium]
EESYGLLVGTHARDKDAIVAVMLLCEAAAFYKKQGLTLWDQMIKIYEKYGFYREGVKSLTLKGLDGAEKIGAIMENLRNNPIKSLAGLDVKEFRDYEKDAVLVMSDGSKHPTGLPKSNVLYYEFEDNAWCCVRPSGTEPKIKFYMGVKGTDLNDANKKLSELSDGFMGLVQE